ncbi:ArsR/SmtB family transcription factor [Allorhizocola rhizosphaerae]|uniref:ArsR/SmtB family transcription factor n=1 Tax=Allorhizocola rhizosphaerae TaxID=1872709 RepID=UPI000E3C32A9|nr:helix-turn-helix domain-containing protein [Allorhizocola rhizosphaerae]
MSLKVEDERRARLRALAHPVRLRILSLLTGAALTATEVARELELTHANASYHLRHLHAAGLIDIAGEEKIRGGVAKRYRHDIERQPEEPDPPPDTGGHQLVYAAMAAELRRRSSFMRRGVTNDLTDAELWVDPAIWKAIRDRIKDASHDLHRAARQPRTPGTIRVNATIALFEMEP